MSTRLAVTGPIATVKHIDLWATPLRDRIAASVAANILAFVLIAVAAVLATVSVPSAVVDRLGVVLGVGGALIAVLAVLIGIPLQLSAGHARPTRLRFGIISTLTVAALVGVAGIVVVLTTSIPGGWVAAAAGAVLLCALVSLPLFGPLSRRPALTFAILGVTLIAVAGLAVLGMLS